MTKYLFPNENCQRPSWKSERQEKLSEMHFMIRPVIGMI